MSNNRIMATTHPNSATSKSVSEAYQQNYPKRQRVSRDNIIENLRAAQKSVATDKHRSNTDIYGQLQQCDLNPSFIRACKQLESPGEVRASLLRSIANERNRASDKTDLTAWCGDFKPRALNPQASMRLVERPRSRGWDV